MFGLLAATCVSDGDCKKDEKCCVRQCGGPACVAACEAPTDCPELNVPPGCRLVDQVDANTQCPLCPVLDCPKRGTCPNAPVPPDTAGVGVPVFACHLDTDCPGTQKCCADLWNGLRCVEANTEGGEVCPAASGISCSVGWSSCTEDWQCSGGKKCCADACNHAQCQQPCPKLDCPLAPAVLGGGCVVVQPRPDASGCVTQCPSVECTRDCNSSVPCGDGSGCFESRRCGLLSTGWGCGVQRGDFKCHPLCVTDADCPMSVPQCNEVVLWSQDAAVRRRMCFKCPVAVCPVADVGPGCQVTAAFGYNGCRQCDHVVCDNRRACVAPVCTEPAPTFTPSLCYWNTKRTDDSRCPACPRVSCLADCIVGDPAGREVRTTCSTCACSSFTGKLVCPLRTCSSTCTPFFSSCISCLCVRGALACTHSCHNELVFRLASVPNMTIPMLADYMFDWAKNFAVRPRVFGYEIRNLALSAMVALPKQQPGRREEADDVAALLRAYFVNNGFPERVLVQVPETGTPAPDPEVLEARGGVSPGAVAGIALGVAAGCALVVVVGVVIVRRQRERQRVLRVALQGPPDSSGTSSVEATPTVSEVSEDGHDFNSEPRN